eukprot:gnl/MRDRNA2_/MRDRNA2_57296_c0_seq2.p1 gnl/MRDRNA2_/MRDRNA2_57296_c0~~gnl/MRDRNA2_/MRDRNA2_57296_c0_seq2.p1  ORF type:complete len:205 (+),score=16.64 gnl/MRDRNA2_/MRDRNA2_57296_c0_seq2:106-720(+)
MLKACSGNVCQDSRDSESEVVEKAKVVQQQPLHPYLVEPDEIEAGPFGLHERSTNRSRGKDHRACSVFEECLDVDVFEERHHSSVGHQTPAAKIYKKYDTVRSEMLERRSERPADTTGMQDTDELEPGIRPLPVTSGSMNYNSIDWTHDVKPLHQVGGIKDTATTKTDTPSIGGIGPFVIGSTKNTSRPNSKRNPYFEHFKSHD